MHIIIGIIKDCCRIILLGKAGRKETGAKFWVDCGSAISFERNLGRFRVHAENSSTSTDYIADFKRHKNWEWGFQFLSAFIPSLLFTRSKTAHAQESVRIAKQFRVLPNFALRKLLENSDSYLGFVVTRYQTPNRRQPLRNHI